MELDGLTIGTVTGIVAAGAKWVFARVDKQFEEAEKKAERAREEIKAESDRVKAEFRKELSDCDAKHEKCESDRLKILEEVIGLRAEVKAVVRSQGIETERRATEGPR